MPQPAAHSLRVLLAATLLALAALAWFPRGNAPGLSAGAQSGWSTPVAISVRPAYNWFPDITVDSYGKLHIVWSKTSPRLDGTGLLEQVAYLSRQDNTWSDIADIVPPSYDIERTAITADRAGTLHLLTGGSERTILSVYYQQARIEDAWNSRAWMREKRLTMGVSYMGDIAVDSQGVIHVVYDDTLIAGQNPNDPNLADIYYRRSTDNGRSWSDPVNLFSELKTGSAKPAIKIDNRDVIHVTWDEGWDRLSGRTAEKFHSVYMNSQDGGLSWSQPVIIDTPAGNATQLAAAADGEGNVMLVWCGKDDASRFYYQRSADDGVTWSEPAVIEGLLARPWTIPFDMYDLLADSAGHFHLLAVGRTEAFDNAVLGIYHVTFNGEAWSAPVKIYGSENYYPGYPKLAIQNGNRLHAVWFTAENDLWDQTVNRDIWYATLALDTPFIPSVVLPTETPPPAVVTVTPEPTATIRPTLGASSVNGPEIYKEHQYLSVMAVGVAPAVLLIGLAIVMRQVISSRRKQ